MKSPGIIAEAKPLYEEALSIRRRVLDVDQPDLADSLNKLANWYHAQGKYDEAEPLCDEALSITRRVLGVEHPKTKIVRENYERLLAKMQEKGAE